MDSVRKVKKSAGRNLLVRWYPEAIVLVERDGLTCNLSAQKVQAIYAAFVHHFGLKFFQINPGYKPEMRKTSWLFALLSNTDKLSCIHALYDIYQLLRYLDTLEEKIRKEFISQKKNPEGLRNFFFELFLFRLLDAAPIENTKKPVVDGVELDAVCAILGVLFLVECRKIYMPRIEELGVMTRLMADIHQKISEQKTLADFVATIKLNRPIKGKHVNIFQDIVTAYFHRLDQSSGSNVPFEQNLPEGRFLAEPYDEAKLARILRDNNYDIVFHCYLDGKKFTGDVKSVYEVMQPAIDEKLRTVIEEKRDQHRHSPIVNKIFFFDSETLPEIHMNIFHSEGTLDYQQITKLYSRLNMPEIVCILQRSYTDQRPVMNAIVLTPPHLVPVGTILIAVIKKANHYRDLFHSQPI